MSMSDLDKDFEHPVQDTRGDFSVGPKQISEPIKHKGRLLVLWVLANAAGTLLAWCASYVLRFALLSVLGEGNSGTFSWWSSILGVVASLNTGLLLGTAQWLVMRQIRTSMPWRIWAIITALA